MLNLRQVDEDRIHTSRILDSSVLFVRPSLLVEETGADILCGNEDQENGSPDLGSQNAASSTHP